MLSPWAMCSPNFSLLLVVSGSIQNCMPVLVVSCIAVHACIHIWVHVLRFFPSSITHGLMESASALVSKLASIDLQVWPHIDG